MKYKCITKYFIEDSVIMNPGDIVVIDEDNLFNITTGVDYRNIPDIENLKSCVEEITDYCNTSTSKTDADRFKDITKIMSDIFIRKNHDYGNSFAQQRLRRKDSILVRLYDKYLRIEQLMNSEAKVKDESIEDTLLDLANYCIMEVVERYIEREAEYKANQQFAPVCIGVQKDEGGANV